MTSLDAPDDVAVRVNEFAALVAAGQPVAASSAMLDWVGVDDQRTRLFATTAAALVVARLPKPAGGFWRLDPPIPGVTQVEPHNMAMCQVVVRIANGEPHVALDLLNAHRFVYGTTGLFWLGVCAVRLLADLLPTTEGTRL